MVTSPIDASALFHTGIIVDDIDAAKAEYTDLIGVTWGFQGEVEMPVWLPEGSQTMSFGFAYTVEGPHYIELVRSVPNTLWSVPGAGHAHHLGYWCDDVAAASAELVRRGLPVCAKVGVSDAEADAPIVFHRWRTGMYVELCDAADRDAFFGGES